MDSYPAFGWISTCTRAWARGLRSHQEAKTRNQKRTTTSMLCFLSILNPPKKLPKHPKTSEPKLPTFFRAPKTSLNLFKKRFQPKLNGFWMVHRGPQVGPSLKTPPLPIGSLRTSWGHQGKWIKTEVPGEDPAIKLLSHNKKTRNTS